MSINLFCDSTGCMAEEKLQHQKITFAFAHLSGKSVPAVVGRMVTELAERFIVSIMSELGTECFILKITDDRDDLFMYRNDPDR